MTVPDVHRLRFSGAVDADGHILEPPDLWERYLVGPETSLDPAHWRTELNEPLLG